jgi:L-ascorbate metabolism protein UlaG (beta-lactamase superfamily)
MGAGHDDTRPAEGHARGMATDAQRLGIRYVGGPTALLRVGGLHLLTDPTFDPPGEHPVGDRVLHKTAGPAVGPQGLGAVDAVLLSHDQHPDNLDTLGRAYLTGVPLVLSTASAQDRLGGNVRALAAWTSVELPRPGRRALQVTGVPAQHGPDGSEHLVGQVTGFVLRGEGLPTVYVSGDNASLDVVGAIAGRVGPVDVAVLFAGAARTALAGGAYLTLTSQPPPRRPGSSMPERWSRCTSRDGPTSPRVATPSRPPSTAPAWRTGCACPSRAAWSSSVLRAYQVVEPVPERS